MFTKSQYMYTKFVKCTIQGGEAPQIAWVYWSDVGPSTFVLSARRRQYTSGHCTLAHWFADGPIYRANIGTMSTVTNDNIGPSVVQHGSFLPLLARYWTDTGPMCQIDSNVGPMYIRRQTNVWFFYIQNLSWPTDRHLHIQKYYVNFISF